MEQEVSKDESADPARPVLILASASPHRRTLLERLRLPFRVESADVDESSRPDETPSQLAWRLAADKARAVGSRHAGSHALIIGSDQVADLDGQPMGKPGTLSRAAAQLRALSGRRLVLHTGLSLFDCRSQRQRTLVEPFRVRFRALSDAAIDRYLQMEQPLDAAGSFYAEALGIVLFESFDGRDPNALVGLPLMALVDLLAEFQMDVLAP